MIDEDADRQVKRQSSALGQCATGMGNRMSIRLKLATGLAGVAIATTALVTGGAVIGATAASATTHNCSHSHPKYPPGKCKIYVTHHKVHRHSHLGVASGAVFTPHERVTVTLVCPKSNYSHKFFPKRAGHSGALLATIYISNKTPAGNCSLIVHGKHSHVTLTTTVHIAP
jgi:hypothetical protein